jgi:hypothetical protein
MSCGLEALKDAKTILLTDLRHVREYRPRRRPSVLPLDEPTSSAAADDPAREETT